VDGLHEATAFIESSETVKITRESRNRRGKVVSRTPTETTICGSHELAGWDRGVDAAFKAPLARSPEKARDLRDNQKAWLKKRDACGAKAECVDELLWQRVEELAQK